MLTMPKKFYLFGNLKAQPLDFNRTKKGVVSTFFPIKAFSTVSTNR